MLKKYFICFFIIIAGSEGFSQQINNDTIPPMADEGMGIDTSLDYDDLLSDLELFMDSILSPRSYFLSSLSVGQGYFNFTNNSNNTIKVVQKFTFSPTLGYYGKSGFGFNVTGYMIRDSQRMNLYQFSISPSYDYLDNRDMAAGIAYLRYFTKNSLRFYTSPLRNEVNGYFLWRKSWLQPGIAVNYGRGSRTEYQKQLKFIRALQRRVVVITTKEESVSDFALTASLRHNFYWLNIFSGKDYFKITPQLAFSSGTQKFGFNQTTGTYGIRTNNLLYNAGQVNLDEELKFQPLSMTLYVRPEYSIGKFFFQPQFIVDYYFPAKDKKLTTLFSINTGFSF